MEDKLSGLIRYAALDIVEFDIHKYPPRTAMNVVDRVPPYYIMSYLKEGLAKVRFRGETFVTEPGTVVILPPGEPHDHVRISEDPAVFLWWHFTFKIAGVVDLLKLVPVPLRFTMSDSEAFERVFNDYIELSRKTVSVANLILHKAKGLEVMAYLLDSAFTLPPHAAGGVPEPFVDMLLDIVRSPQRGVSLQDIAAKYHLHPTYISNRFKAYFGISPVQLHRDVAVEHAKTLLRTGMSVGETAAALGYDDLSAFTRFFTGRTGMAPSKYKQSN